MASQPQRADVKDRAPIAGEAFLRALADHGIDYFFANPGTDFAPVVEAFSRARQSNAKVPTPLVIPHENLAVAMAHGVYLMTGRPQAVMLHVNVGTANAINNIINLNRDNVPLILAAGGTPITEKGKFGSRNRYIHWAQEMFDQGGMLREAVKWDYELRVPEQVGDVVSRAYEVTMTSPRGPVYLVLPREPLAATLAEPIGQVEAAQRAGAAAPGSTAHRHAGRMDRRSREADDHRHDGRGERSPAAWPPGGEIRDPGGHAAATRRLPAVEPSHAHGLRPAGADPGSRPRNRDRGRRALHPGRAGAEGRLQVRHHRRGPGVRALPDAKLPERPRDHRDGDQRGRGARAGARQAEPTRGARQRPSRPCRRAQAQADRAACQGFGHAPRRQDHTRLSQPRHRRDRRQRRRHLQ